MGAKVDVIDSETVVVSGALEQMFPVRIVALPHPGFPTDALPMLVVALGLIDGLSTVKDDVFPERFAYVPELQRMGARLSVGDNSLQISGAGGYKGQVVIGTDLRATAALALAALAAEGETILRNADHIARGYSDFLVSCVRLVRKWRLFMSETISKLELERIGRYVLVETPIQMADIGFVFGTRHGVDEFVREIVRCWWLGYFSKLVVTGGVTPGGHRSEAIEIGERLLELGLPPDDLILEENSTNTGENVKEAIPLINETIGLSNVRSILAIGKISASRRYLMTLQRHWPEPVKMLHPVNYHNVASEDWYRDPEFRRRVVTEWEKIPLYLDNGFLAEVSAS
ncbi:MAG: YdcF family protein [Parvibaculaceae bacterium]|nr:YdcF family protein [Parvibaculaceae bacterium]